MKFAIPEGMVPPDGVEVGSTFDALATLKLGEGDLELIAIDGLPVSSDSEESDSEDMKEDMSEKSGDEMGFDEAVRAGMMKE